MHQKKKTPEKHNASEPELVDQVLAEEGADPLVPEGDTEGQKAGGCGGKCQGNCESQCKGKCRAQADEYLDDLKRLQADFENYKKRQAESQKELGGYLIEKLLLDIIPVLDNFRAANSHVPAGQKDSPWVTGIQYIEKQLETVLTDHGLQVLEPQIGDKFDPTHHEAIEHEQGEEENASENTITKVHQKGYQSGSRVIRPAKVTVK